MSSENSRGRITVAKPGLTVTKFLSSYVAKAKPSEESNCREVTSSGQWEWNYVPSGQRLATNIDSDSPEDPVTWVR